MKRNIVWPLTFCFALAVAAQTATLPRYKVVRGSMDKAAAAEWNAAADQGYRLLFEGRLAVMRLDAAPPDTYRYQALPDRNLRATFLNALNEQGAFGYAWLPNTRMLEKLPHPRTYEYTVVEGILAKKRASSLDELVAQGFVPVGRFGSVPIYMRETDVSPAPASASPSARMLDRMNHRKLLKQIIENGQQGYRYKQNSITDKGDMVMMEKCGPSCGRGFEYRSIEIKSVAQLETELNTLGSQGFRVVADSLQHPPEIVERSAGGSIQYAYRVGEAKEPAALEQFLNTGDGDGFAPVGFAAHIGWTADVMIVLEKATAPAAQAQ